jgi:hypothetical protein
VYEARGDDEAGRVNYARGALLEIAHRDDPATADTNIAAVGRDASAVHNRAVSDNDVVLSHGWPSFRSLSSGLEIVLTIYNSLSFPYWLFISGAGGRC